MKKVAKIRLKPKFVPYLKALGILVCLILGVFLFYEKQIHDLTKLGYSKKASQAILFSFHKDYILSVGENPTLNAVFESDQFQEEYLDQYRKIQYVNQEHFVSNLHKLFKLGYSTNDINIIFAHGDDAAVGRFAKREKIKYLEEFFIVPYAKLDNYDRYVHYADDTGEDEELTVLYVNLDLDKEDYEDAHLVDSFSTDMLVNKHRYLSSDFVPTDLAMIDSQYASSDDLQASRLAINAFRKMADAAEREGYQIVINSAYRSYQDQVDLTELYFNTYGQGYVDKYVAKPGFSEHQTGLAFDVGSRNTNVFANSKEYQWMQENSYKYGFIARFEKRFEAITGFRQEAWHYRYVGEEIASYIHEHSIPFEEYWAMFLDQRR